MCVFKFNITSLVLILFVSIGQLNGQNASHRTEMVVDRVRPAEWKNLVFGGRFMDNFLKMPDLGGMTDQTWGEINVVPRDIDNGIEDLNWSYWGGNIRLDKNGKYHLLVCRWPENDEKGHFAYPNSIVVHAVSDHPSGPFKVVGEIGPGHNPEWYVTLSGKYVLYVVGGAYMADDIYGPWKSIKLEYNTRDRNGEMNSVNSLHNNTFARREDGSFIMINRKGDVWFSKDGISEYNRVTAKNVYPPAVGRYEDPVVWRDNIQYHLIVNDWQGRIAWYLRSKDGVTWKVEPGEAYMPGVSVQQNGKVEDWHKYERIRILQDGYGRAIQANFAVIDADKYDDLPNDNHSSKNICIPLTKSRLLEVLNKKPITSDTKSIQLKILAEDDFNPNTDMDINSLRFGSSDEVNFGRGAKVTDTKKVGNDLVVTFDGSGNGLTTNDYAAKLLGKTQDGKLLFGFSRLPGVSYLDPILSSMSPVVIGDHKIEIEVQNFGQVASKTALVSVYSNNTGAQILLATGTVGSLKSFGKDVIQLSTNESVTGMAKSNFDVYINQGKVDEVVLFGKQLK